MTAAQQGTQDPGPRTQDQILLIPRGFRASGVRAGIKPSGGLDLAVLEPPALFAQNYGRRTVAVTLLAHVAYGAILGAFLKP